MTDVDEQDRQQTGAQAARPLSREEKKEGKRLGDDLSSTLMATMSNAIRWANAKAEVERVDPAEFWRRLFYPNRRGKTILERKSGDQEPESPPEDPYQELDLQACNKYLLFGGERMLPGGRETRYAWDSYNFFACFGIPYRQRPRPTNDGWIPCGPDEEYRSALYSAIDMRNRYAHVKQATIERITAEGVAKDIALARELTKYIWRAAEEDPQLANALENQRFDWAEIERRYRECFDFSPLKKDLHKELHTEDKDIRPSVPELRPLKPETVQTLRALGDNRVIGEEDTNTVGALLDGFNLVVDESIFLHKEGRNFLVTTLRDLLRERGENLCLDVSVPRALFERVRANDVSADRDQEEPERELTEEEQEEKREYEKLRRDLHNNARSAVKAMRTLQESGCLTIVSDAADDQSRDSYDSIVELVQTHPGNHFLVLTQDKALVEKLGQLPGRNAVAMKVNLNETLVLYSHTYGILQEMLSQSVPAPSVPAPSVPNRPAATRAPSVVFPTTPVEMSRERLPLTTELPGEGSCLTVQGYGGQVTLGEPMGLPGGEGTVYQVVGDDAQVAKIYHENQLTKGRLDKLTAMVAKNPGIPTLCWPTNLLYNQKGEWVGFLMPRVRNAVELAMTVYRPGKNYHNIVDRGWTRKDLARIAANVARNFDRMHRAGILMGDVNPRNIMVDEDRQTWFVDCDSYQFEGYACPVGTERYTPPEVLREMRDKKDTVPGEMRLRTLENELHTMAVILFEILMMGKSPYESRGAKQAELGDAIVSARFPYPFNHEGKDADNKDDEDGDEDQKDDKLRPPVGRWREIWSNTTYKVKEHFFNTFSMAGERVSAAEWFWVLDDYARKIERGENSDELFPQTYKDKEGVLEEHICKECGKTYKIDAETYAKRQKRGEDDLCPMHRDIWEILRESPEQVTCDECGESFVCMAYVWIQRWREGQPLYCPKCLEKHMPLQTCECGESFRVSREKLAELQDKGRKALCKKCRNKHSDAGK